MELALVLRELWDRKIALALGLLVAIVAAVLSVYRLDGFKLKPRALQYSGATTQVFVDAPSTVLGNVTSAVAPLTTVATLDANFMASPTVLNSIGQIAGVPGDQIYAAGPVDPSQPRAVVEPTALKRNVQLTGETAPYKLEFSNDPNLPMVGIYSQAPTTKQAIALANAAASGLAGYVTNLQATENVPPKFRLTIRQLGRAVGGVVNAGISKKLAGIVFFAVFVLWCVLVLVGSRFRKTWQASAQAYGRAPMQVVPGPGRTAELGEAKNGDVLGNGHEGQQGPTADGPRRQGPDPRHAFDVSTRRFVR
jgi:hypothetical protein